MFHFNKAAVSDIYNFLAICDQAFIPALSSQVNIRRYSEKLYENAETVEFWTNGRLSGLVAFYCNDHERKTAYVTSVGVLPEFQGIGIAKEMLKKTIEIAIEENMEFMRLEVGRQNERAANMYRRLNFRVLSESTHTLLMEKKIGDEKGAEE